MKKKILFITGQILSSSAQGIRYRNLFEQWAEQFDITVVTEKKFIGNNPKINTINLKKANALTDSLLPKSHVLSAIFNLQFLKNLINGLFFPDRFILKLTAYKRIIKNFLNEKKFEIIIIGVAPFSLLKLVKWIKNKYNTQVCIDLSDPFTANALLVKNPITKWLAYRYEKKYLLSADKLIVLNEQIKRFYIQKIKIDSGNIEVVEQGFSNLFINTKPIFNRTNQVETIKLIYAGGFYKHFREPFELYKAIRQCKKNVELKVYGNIRKSFIPKNAKNVIYLGTIPQDKLVEAYYNSDVIVFIDNFTGIQVPGKTLELMLLFKPVLFIYQNIGSPTLTYIKHNPYTITVPNKPEEIAEVIDTTEFGEMKFNEDYIVYYQKYAWENLARKYIAFLEN